MHVGVTILTAQVNTAQIRPVALCLPAGAVLGAYGPAGPAAAPAGRYGTSSSQLCAVDAAVCWGGAAACRVFMLGQHAGLDCLCVCMHSCAAWFGTPGPVL